MKKHIVQLKNWILILVALLSFGGLSKDVKAALEHETCSIEDFKALLSPAAAPFQEHISIP